MVRCACGLSVNNAVLPHFVFTNKESGRYAPASLLQVSIPVGEIRESS